MGLGRETGNGTERKNWNGAGGTNWEWDCKEKGMGLGKKLGVGLGETGNGTEMNWNEAMQENGNQGVEPGLFYCRNGSATVGCTLLCHGPRAGFPRNIPHDICLLPALLPAQSAVGGGI